MELACMGCFGWNFFPQAHGFCGLSSANQSNTEIYCSPAELVDKQEKETFAQFKAYICNMNRKSKGG